MIVRLIAAALAQALSRRLPPAAFCGRQDAPGGSPVNCSRRGNGKTRKTDRNDALSFSPGIHELPRGENGQFSDCLRGEVPHVARNQGAFERDRAFREQGIVGIRKTADKMGRRKSGKKKREKGQA